MSLEQLFYIFDLYIGDSSQCSSGKDCDQGWLWHKFKTLAYLARWNLTHLGWRTVCTSLCTSLTDSFSYTAWHHVDCADAVKPNPSVWCFGQVKPDCNSFLHIAVVLWEPLTSLFSTAGLTRAWIVSLSGKLPVQLKLILMEFLWSDLYIKWWSSTFLFTDVSLDTAFLWWSTDVSDPSAVSEKKIRSEGERKWSWCEIVIKPPTANIKGPLASSVETSVKYRIVLSQNMRERFWRLETNIPLDDKCFIHLFPLCPPSHCPGLWKSKQRHEGSVKLWHTWDEAVFVLIANINKSNTYSREWCCWEHLTSQCHSREQGKTTSPCS